LNIFLVNETIVTIIIKIKGFHISAKNKITKNQKIDEQTAKPNNIILGKYWQTARIISLAQLKNHEFIHTIPTKKLTIKGSLYVRE